MNTFEQIQAATAELRAENIRLQASRIRWRLACLLLVVFALAASFAQGPVEAFGQGGPHLSTGPEHDGVSLKPSRKGDVCSVRLRE